MIKALVKWIRLGEARQGKVEFSDILTLPIQQEMLDMLIDLSSTGIAIMRCFIELQTQSCLERDILENILNVLCLFVTRE